MWLDPNDIMEHAWLGAENLAAMWPRPNRATQPKWANTVTSKHAGGTQPKAVDQRAQKAKRKAAQATRRMNRGK